MGSNEIGWNHICMGELLQSNLRNPFHLGKIVLCSSQNNNKNCIFQHCKKTPKPDRMINVLPTQRTEWPFNFHLGCSYQRSKKGRENGSFSWQARLLLTAVNFRDCQQGVWLGAWICSPTQAYPLSSMTAKLFLPFKANLSEVNAKLKSIHRHLQSSLQLCNPCICLEGERHVNG